MSFRVTWGWGAVTLMVCAGYGIALYGQGLATTRVAPDRHYAHPTLRSTTDVERLLPCLAGSRYSLTTADYIEVSPDRIGVSPTGEPPLTLVPSGPDSSWRPADDASRKTLADLGCR